MRKHLAVQVILVIFVVMAVIAGTGLVVRAVQGSSGSGSGLGLRINVLPALPDAGALSRRLNLLGYVYLRQSGGGGGGGSGVVPTPPQTTMSPPPVLPPASTTVVPVPTATVVTPPVVTSPTVVVPATSPTVTVPSVTSTVVPVTPVVQPTGTQAGGGSERVAGWFWVLFGSIGFVILMVVVAVWIWRRLVQQ